MRLVGCYVGAAQLVALLDREEDRHRSAVSSLRIELEAEAPFMTTNYEVLKASLALQRRHGPEGAGTLLLAAVPFLHLEWVSRADHEAGVAAFLSGLRQTHPVAADADEPPPHAADLADHVALEVMRRVGAEPMIP